MLTAVRRRLPTRARRLAAWGAAPLLLAVAVAPVAFTPAAGAAPAAHSGTARPHLTYDQYVLDSPVIAKTSSTHTALKVFFSVSSSDIDSVQPEGEVDVTLVGAGEVESHLWEFQVPYKSISASSSSLSVSTGSKLGAFGSIKLSTAKSGASKLQCIGDSEVTDQPVSVKETYTFNTRSTGSKAWGTVTGSTTVAKGSISSFSETPCASKVNDCSSGVTWDLIQVTSTGSGYVFLGNSGVDGLGKVGDDELGRVTNLSSPAGATRTDVILAKEPVPTIKRAGKTASLKVTTSGSNITGSATLKSIKAASTEKEVCSSTKTETDVTWLSSFTNGSAPLTAHEQIEGNFSAKNVSKAGNTDGAYIEQSTTS